MGIRFDKDTRRATNGPMIFFSDPSADVNLNEEIRGAIEAKLSVYAYRFPGDMMISYGSSEGTVEGIGSPGFVIAPFLPGMPSLTIPYKYVKTSVQDNIHGFSFPEKSTAKSEHSAEVEAIKDAIADIESGKIIAARVTVGHGSIDVGSTFAELCRHHPDAFVFFFSTPQTGCWIGASPELLLQSKGDFIETMALAGTRKAGSQDNWDIKNIEEQKIVADFIYEAVRSNGFHPVMGDLYSQKAGSIEHLCTPVRASVPCGLDPENLKQLLQTLSPTPALCGIPRDLALKVIGEYENFERAYYGGFCGPFHSTSDFSFYVNLRCCHVKADRYCIFTGGGITLRSNASDEWDETTAKSATISDCLRFL